MYFVASKAERREKIKKRNVKSFSILIALFTVIGMVAAGLPLAVNATEKTTGGARRTKNARNLHCPRGLL